MTREELAQAIDDRTWLVLNTGIGEHLVQCTRLASTSSHLCFVRFAGSTMDMYVKTHHLRLATAQDMLEL